jgi:integrase
MSSSLTGDVALRWIITTLFGASIATYVYGLVAQYGRWTSTINHLLHLMMSAAEELAALMVEKGRDDLVFTSLRGNVLRASNYRRWVFASAVEECRNVDNTFPTITPHDLRHTAASLAVSAGANVKAVQRMLGHAKASMTLDVYAELFDEDLDGVADRLDMAIRSTADQLRTSSAP